MNHLDKIIGRVLKCALMLILNICIRSLFCFKSIYAQDIDLKTYDSVEEGLFFDQVLIYEYSDHTGKSGEIWIYLNSCNYRLLFDQSAWGMEDEMIHYVIGQQDGSYITFGTEAEGSSSGKVALVDSIYLKPVQADLKYPISDDFVSFEKIPFVGKNNFGLDEKSFTIKKTMDTRGKESISVARVGFDTRLIYDFNSLGGDLQIHHLLGNPYPYLHPQDLITSYESSYKTNHGERYWSTLKLVVFEYTNYWAPIDGYKLKIINNSERICEYEISELLNLDSC